MYQGEQYGKCGDWVEVKYSRLWEFHSDGEKKKSKKKRR